MTAALQVAVRRGIGAALLATVLLPPAAWLIAAAVRSAIADAAGSFDAVALRLLGRSCTLALVAAALGVVAGMPYGWLMARAAIPGRRWLARLTVLPLLLPPYCAAHAWSLLAMPGGAGLSPTPPAPGTPEAMAPQALLPLAAAVLAGCYWPLCAWSAYLAARSIPRELEDEARMHEGPAAAALRAAGPELRAAAAASGLLLFLLAVADFGVANTLGVVTYPVDVVNRFQQSRDPGFAARWATPLLIAALPLLILQLRLLARLEPAVWGDGARPGVLLPGRAWGTAWCCLVLAASFGAPLLVLGAGSLPLATYGRVWQESAGHFCNSLIFGASAAALCALLAVLGGWLLRPRPPLWLEVLLTLPVAAPASLPAVAVIQLAASPLVPHAVYDSSLPLVWIYAVLFFPFAARLTQPALARVDRDLLDDAALCGAGSLACFRIVVWPSLREPAAAGAILVLLLAGREIDATALLRVPDGDTVAFRVYDYLHFAPGPNVAALSVLIVLAGAAVTGLFAFWLRLGRDE